jgi:hypothetical protein
MYDIKKDRRSGVTAGANNDDGWLVVVKSNDDVEIKKNKGKAKDDGV